MGIKTSAFRVSTLICMDCQVDTGEINEYYMVHDEVWLFANPNDSGILCVGCLEMRLGRELASSDFPDYPINQGFFEQSDRLKSRLNN